MRKSLWIIALVVVTLGTPCVHATETTWVLSNVTFQDGATANGSFDFASPNNYSNVAITVADLTNPAYDGNYDIIVSMNPNELDVKDSEGVTLDLIFVKALTTLPPLTSDSINAETVIFNNSSEDNILGAQTISVTPEPGTAILWLTGIGLMILTRKRIAQLLPDWTMGTQRSLSPH